MTMIMREATMATMVMMRGDDDDSDDDYDGEGEDDFNDHGGGDGDDGSPQGPKQEEQRPNAICVKPVMTRAHAQGHPKPRPNTGLCGKAGKNATSARKTHRAYQGENKKKQKKKEKEGEEEEEEKKKKERRRRRRRRRATKAKARVSEDMGNKRTGKDLGSPEFKTKGMKIKLVIVRGNVRSEGEWG